MIKITSYPLICHLLYLFGFHSNAEGVEYVNDFELEWIHMVLNYSFL